jgi:hypothetical protein
MEKIELPQSRDIGQTIGDPFLFARHNIGFLTRGFLYYGVPPLLVAVAIMAFGFKDLFSNMGPLSSPSSSPFSHGLAGLGASVLIAYMLFFLISMFQQVYVSTFMVLKENSEDVTNNDVIQRLKTDWVTIVVTVLFLILFGVVAGALFVGLVGSAVRLGPGTAGFLTFCMIVFFAYIFIPLSNLLFIRLREKLGIFAAVAQAFRIAYGKWWRTFIAFFVVFIVFYSLIFLLLVPMYIVMGVVMYHATSAGVTPSVSSLYLNPVSEVILTLTTFVSFFLQNIFTVFIGINYFSLSEKYSNFHLIAQIEKIGDREDKSTRRQEGEY